DEEPGEDEPRGEAGKAPEDIPPEKRERRQAEQIEEQVGGLGDGPDREGKGYQETLQRPRDLDLGRAETQDVGAEVGPRAGGVALQTDRVDLGLGLRDYDRRADEAEQEAERERRQEERGETSVRKEKMSAVVRIIGRHHNGLGGSVITGEVERGKFRLRP